VKLEARAGALDHRAVVAGFEVIDAVDHQREALTARRHASIVEALVTHFGGQVGERDVLLLQRGQNARQHDTGTDRVGGVIGLQQDLPQTGFHVTQKVAAEGCGIEICLEVESRQFGAETLVGDIFQYTVRNRRRKVLRVDDIHFLFDAHAAHIAFDQTFLDHDFERANVVQQRPHVGARTLLV
jgi:hypothetical protein